ncbi:LuxR family transcriptional regulator [Labrys okinawensis]|uniref:LuxR family transcriptional regulator n=1 Tax=Labrys okinawensis TaxID=346911 RepID=A0A2S9Q5Y7_9HYPH|nr:autoinducer binding domain-containing protein [Labrys okinawensis]PRH84769.1 LuxR family transcriptional regulator [Labrys okinawensis]
MRVLNTPETWRFVEAIERADDSNAVLAVLLEFAFRFGISSVFGGFVPPPEPVLPQSDIAERTLLFKFPQAWAMRYAERRYLFRDPIVRGLRTVTGAFTWAQAYERYAAEPASKRVRDEAAEFRLREGYVIPVTTLEGQLCGVSLGGERFEANERERAALNFLVSFAVGHLIGLRRGCEPIERKHDPDFDFHLTHREHDCILWAGEGKTDWEIARIMGISRSTVIKHILSAREKLGAINRSQLLVLAMRARLLQ